MKKNLFIAALLFISIGSFSQDLGTITFEEPDKYLIIDNSSSNIWQIGKPSKTLFNSAFGGSKAIVTDTLHNYPVNNKSSFIVNIGNFNYALYPHNIFMEIQHKYNTDTLHDGCYIDVSYDKGLSWTNIIKDHIFWGVTPAWIISGNKNLYTLSDTLFNGEFGFSGNSKGWLSTTFAWYNIPEKSGYDVPDTMMVRFNFISDSKPSNKEGWMIDNIRVYPGDIGGSVKSFKNLNFALTPNPMDQNTTITLTKNYHKISLEIFSLRGQLLLKKNYADQKVIVLNRESLSSGMYMMKIQADNAFSGQSKLIVK